MDLILANKKELLGKVFPECFSLNLISVQGGEQISVRAGGGKDGAGPWPNWDQKAAVLEYAREKKKFGSS